MSNNRKLKKRGFVMTGGGAKGLYEAGVIHAFHITGMDFDVITGSSIGAINAIIYAEYLRRKRCLSPEIQANTDDVIKKLDPFIKAFHYAWLRMESLNIIDDGDTGPLGRLKNDLARSRIDLGLITRLIWWRTTPKKLNPSISLFDILRLLKELVNRVGLIRAMRVLGEMRSEGNLKDALLGAYLERMDLQRSFVLPDSPGENAIRDAFTREELVLKSEHLKEDYIPRDDEEGPRVKLLDPQKTLADYKDMGIEVRLTRANYRTGRLELSAYYTAEDFVRYLKSHAWRWIEAPQETPPLGSHRLQMPGNPTAIGAALASGRFPGVFAPMPIERIYDLDHPDNELLRRILSFWLDDTKVEATLTEAYRSLEPIANKPDRWQEQYDKWRKSDRLKYFFPRATDSYVDGGAIDNTPTNSAVDSIREWISRQGLSKREVILDLYIVLLHPEPFLEAAEMQDPALYQVVGRTLSIQSAAKLTSDAAVVNTINGFGRQGELLGESLKILIEALKPLFDTLDTGEKKDLEDRIRDLAKKREIQGYRSSRDVLKKLESWTEEKVSDDLPLHVEQVKIYPDNMPLNTLHFTQRLGYRKDKAILMLTMGCYNTLWSLRAFLEKQGDKLNESDRPVLELARKWMGQTPWPKTDEEQKAHQKSWQCQRLDCVFHQRHCPHGANRTQ